MEQIARVRKAHEAWIAAYELAHHDTEKAKRDDLMAEMIRRTHERFDPHTITGSVDWSKGGE